MMRGSIDKYPFTVVKENEKYKKLNDIHNNCHLEYNNA